jgi:hypothetical protein
MSTAKQHDDDAIGFDPRRPKRIRPYVGGSVAADVHAALRAEAEQRSDIPFAHVLEQVLRRGLGLPDPRP